MVSLCVCLLVTFVSYAKKAEPIEMRFGRLTRMGHGTTYFMQSRREGTIFMRLSGPLKSIGSFCCGIRNKRDHSVINNRHDMRYAAFPQNS